MSKKIFTITIFFALVAILTPLFLTGQGGFASVSASVDTNPAVGSLKITADEAGLSSNKDPIDIAATIVEFLLGFLGIIFIVLLMYGGFLRMTAQGAAEKVSTSMKIITSAIIGVFIILASWIITAFVFDQVNQQVGEGGAVGGGDNTCPIACYSSPCTGRLIEISNTNCATGTYCCVAGPF